MHCGTRCGKRQVREVTLKENGVEVNCVCITALCDWFKKRVPLSRPIIRKTKKKIQTNKMNAHTRFSALGVVHLNFLQVLISSSRCFCLFCDWSVKLLWFRSFTLALILEIALNTQLSLP